MVKYSPWREIYIPPPEEGNRVFLKPNFELNPKNSSWEKIKEFFRGRLDDLLYKRSDCCCGDIDYCYAVEAIKGDDSRMGHIVSMVFGASIYQMAEGKPIWMHDITSPRQFPKQIERTRNGWKLKDDTDLKAKLVYNTHYLMMICVQEQSVGLYFYKTPCCNINAIR